MFNRVLKSPYEPQRYSDMLVAIGGFTVEERARMSQSWFRDPPCIERSPGENYDLWNVQQGMPLERVRAAMRFMLALED